VARALLSWRNPEAVEVVRRHLLWMFEQAERPDSFWGRCYLANGRVKDSAFQLDQQLFPLLQLAEYTLETADSNTLSRLRHHIPPLMERLTLLQADGIALFPTDETPADDPIALPYHLSSHILFWRTLNMLQQAGIEGDWRTLANSIYNAVQRYFVTDYQGNRLYAYATDGRGSFHFYHDANDFPLALAPIWNFVSAGDAVWQATVKFAFSEMNQGGFYDGRLGSIHTPAAWPLGDVQDLIIARTLHDEAREKRALTHLRAAAQFDGALPEAYDAASGRVVSRHWFAWPNAAYACAELGAFEQ
jgi:uncharacterized protein